MNNYIKALFRGAFIGLVLGQSLVLLSFILNYKKEIKESRTREDLLLQEVKLLDYQINVLTNQVLGEK